MAYYLGKLAMYKTQFVVVPNNHLAAACLYVSIKICE